MFIRRLGQLFEQYSQATGIRDLRRNCVCVVSTDGAVGIMREALFRPNVRVRFNDDDDCLILFDDVPVVLRHRASPGQAMLMGRHEVPKRSCCDETAFETVMLGFSKGTT